jgi:hypothetical protein
MPSRVLPAVERLALLHRALPPVPTTAQLSHVLPVFVAAHEALAGEPDPEVRRESLAWVEHLVPRSGLGRVLFLSFLVALTERGDHLWALCRTVWQEGFTPAQRHFFYWQRLVRHGHIDGPAAMQPVALYAALLDSVRGTLRASRRWIPPEERDPNRVVVITNQFLGLQHSPTWECVNYCYDLQKHAGKRVLLINTADMPWSLELPYFNAVRFNRLDEHSARASMEFRDETFEFYQCRAPMPDAAEANAILEKVAALRPSFVWSLGHSNVVPDLCSEVVTVLTMPFGTDLPTAFADLYVLPRELRPSDAARMESLGIREDQIIQTPYTYRLPDRSASLTRAQLGLPEDAYIVVIVGNRLQSEITETYAAGLTALLEAVPRMFLAFLGTFPNYEAVVAPHPALRRRSRFLGYHQDVMAVYECCDAYLNPLRYGGGTSSAYALAAGLPVWTPPSGDVANSVGERFFISGLDEVAARVARSLEDPGYRQRWSQLAKDRFREISDREGMIRFIVDQACARASIRRSGSTSPGP